MMPSESIQETATRCRSHIDPEAELSVIQTTEPNVSVALPRNKSSNHEHSNQASIHHETSIPMPRNQRRQPTRNPRRQKVGPQVQHGMMREQAEPTVTPGSPSASQTTSSPEQMKVGQVPVVTFAQATPRQQVELVTFATPVPSSKETDENDTSRASRKRLLMGAAALLVIIVVAFACVMAILSRGTGEASEEQQHQQPALPLQHCTVRLNAEPSLCANLTNGVRVPCECYDFCDGEIVGCYSFQDSLKELRASCDGTFVAGCTREKEPPLIRPNSYGTISLPPTTHAEEETNPPDLPTTSPNEVWHIAPELAYIGTSASTYLALEDENSAQYVAYQWLVAHPLLEQMPSWKRAQLFALATLYYSTQPWDFNARDEWLSYSVDECYWIVPNAFDDEDPDCDAEGHYHRLVLRNDDLHGTAGVPAELGLLTRLSKLDLGENHITGQLSPDLALLLSQSTGLSLFNVRNNDLTGVIPSQLGLLKLTALDLAANSISGVIPSQLGLLTELTGLWLNQNPYLSGTIPSSLCAVSTWTVGIWVDCDRVVCPCDDFCECTK